MDSEESVLDIEDEDDVILIEECSNQLAVVHSDLEDKVESPAVTPFYDSLIGHADSFARQTFHELLSEVSNRSVKILEDRLKVLTHRQLPEIIERQELNEQIILRNSIIANQISKLWDTDSSDRRTSNGDEICSISNEDVNSSYKETNVHSDHENEIRLFQKLNITHKSTLPAQKVPNNSCNKNKQLLYNDEMKTSQEDSHDCSATISRKKVLKKRRVLNEIYNQNPDRVKPKKRALFSMEKYLQSEQTLLDCSVADEKRKSGHEKC